MRLPGFRSAPEGPFYADTPAGLLAADGTHYHTTEALLRDYAGPVLDAVGLDTLVRLSGVWLRSAQTVAVLTLPALLYALVWPASLVVTVLLYLAWRVAAPGLVVPALARAFRVLEHPVLQGLVYVGALSAFAAAGLLGAVGAGLAGFVAFRLGLVGSALRPVMGPMLRALYPLPPADQTLRALIVREALRRGVAVAGTDEIEARVRGFWRRGAD